MWKLHRKSNFPKIVWLAAIYTLAFAFKKYKLSDVEFWRVTGVAIWRKSHVSQPDF